MDNGNKKTLNFSGNKTVMTFGAVLWDVIDGEEHIGGAPYNLAAHLNQLDFDSLLISRVGDDERGIKIKDILRCNSMDVNFIQNDILNETGYVLAEVDSMGIPSYRIPESTAFDHIAYSDELDHLLSENHFDLFCFGSFDQRSSENRETLRLIWENINAGTTFFDVNLRKPYYTKDIIEESLNHADIVKINDEELILLWDMFYGGKVQEESFFKTFPHDFNIEIIVETKGKKGCTVWRDGNTIDVGIPNIESEQVVDTIGSGDAFCAAFLWSYSRGMDMRTCGLNGNLLGSFVAQSSGAVPPLDSELKRYLYKRMKS